MAMKKVEDKNKKVVSTKKKDKVVEAIIEEEKIICEECGKKYLGSLKECPNCGYSVLEKTKKKTFYDDEDDFEEYDDEDEFVSKKEVKVEEVEEEPKKVDKKETKQKENVKKFEKKSVKKEEVSVNKKVSVDSKKSMFTDDSNEIFSFIKILVVIVLLVGVVWLIVSLLNKEIGNDKNNDKDEEEVATIQNDKILASSIFTKEEKTYYVFAYNANEDNEWADYYSVLFSEYNAIENEDKISMFWVDLNDPLNKEVVALTKEDENTKPSKYENLSIYSPALIRIKNGKLDKYYDGDYAIDKLTRLIDEFMEKEEE